MSDKVVYCIVEVKALVAKKNLDPDDCNVEGTYAYTFYADEAKELDASGVADGLDPIVEHALDLFHDKNGISTLDDFNISVRQVPSPKDVPSHADLTVSSAVIKNHRSSPIQSGPRP